MCQCVLHGVGDTLYTGTTQVITEPRPVVVVVVVVAGVSRDSSGGGGILKYTVSNIICTRSLPSRDAGGSNEVIKVASSSSPLCFLNTRPASPCLALPPLDIISHLGTARGPKHQCVITGGLA